MEGTSAVTFVDRRSFEVFGDTQGVLGRFSGSWSIYCRLLREPQQYLWPVRPAVLVVSGRGSLLHCMGMSLTNPKNNTVFP